VLRSFFKEGFGPGGIKPSISLTPSYAKTISRRALPRQGINVRETMDNRPIGGAARGKMLRSAEAGLTRKTLAGRVSKQVLKSGPVGRVRTDKISWRTWNGALVDLPRRSKDLIEFEGGGSTTWVPKYDDIVICAYDLSKFGPRSVVMDALRTHPRRDCRRVYCR